MLQESENLELSRTARLVGNFANEKELFLMMGKFTGQLKELPGSVDMTMQSTLERPISQAAIASSRDDAHLRAAQTLIERELTRPDLPPRDSEALREVLYALREHNVSRIGSIYRSAFAEIRNASGPLKEAFDHLESYFAANRG